MVEMAPHDAEIQEVMQTGHALRMNTLCDIISAAQEKGQLNNKLPASRIAEMIGTLMAGLAASVKSTLDVEQAHLMADQFMDLLV